MKRVGELGNVRAKRDCSNTGSSTHGVLQVFTVMIFVGSISFQDSWQRDSYFLPNFHLGYL
jgi:hypothetical protein